MAAWTSGSDGATIWFRVDESAEVGSGHAFRCYALACELRKAGAKVVFAMASSGEAFRARLARDNIGWVQLPAWRNETPQVSDSRAMRNALVNSGGSPKRCAVVVDGYGFDATWHRAVRAWTGAVCVIDDLSNRPYECELLVDQTFGKSARKYLPWISATCQLCVGAQYALLRQQVGEAKKWGASRQDIRDPLRPEVLVTMGGSDPGNATGAVLTALGGIRGAANLKVTVVLGSLNRHVAQVEQRASIVPVAEVEVLHEVEDVPTLMARADICVSAAGSTLWECCVVGVPTIALQTADNQAEVLAQLANAGAVADGGRADGTESGQLNRALELLLTDEAARSELAARASEICDGGGAARVGRAILELLGG